MLRPVLTSIVVLSLAGAAAHAETREVDNQFRFQMPTGWQDRLPPLPQIKVLIASPRFSETGGNCNVISVDMPELQTADQATLDAAGDQVFTDDFWKTQTSKLQNPTIEKTGKRKQGGRQIYSVQLSADFPGPDGAPIRATEQQDVHLVAGRMFMVTCAARSTAFDREADDISTVLTSFEPIVSVPTAMLQPRERPSLTLYEHAQFAGVSRVVTQDTANLAQFGWSSPASSVSIAGSATWQVCDGANFTGRCVTLGATAPSLPALTAASVRRVAVRPGQIIAAGAAVGEAAQRGLSLAAQRR